MCGIVGYVGSQESAGILVDGLRKLEYRGYDSAGGAVHDGDWIEGASGRLATTRPTPGRAAPFLDGRSSVELL